MSEIRTVLIAAIAKNGIIGRGGSMPWHLPADLSHFKQLTVGHPVIIGRRTYESVLDALGKPFPNRTTVVLTSQSLSVPDGAVVAHSIDDALERARSDAERRGVNRVYVAGGGNVYAQFLDDADVLELTELEDAYEGDTAFPTFDTEKWAETARETHEKYDFVTYERVETSN